MIGNFNNFDFLTFEGYDATEKPNQDILTEVEEKTTLTLSISMISAPDGE